MTSLPNLLTLSRIAAIPLIVGFLYLKSDFWSWAAFVLYAAACITDFFDGYIARRMDRVSALGRFLDPIADKLIIASIIMVLVATYHITGWATLAALIILCREILVSGLREFLAELRVGVPVSVLAKWKTMVQMVALGFLIIGDAGPAAINCPLIGQILLWIAAALTLITGYDYLIVGLKHMSADDSGGAA
jgi:cardiolipin synthase